MFVVEQVLCIGCGKCVGACGSKAISLQAGKAVINQAVCIQCGFCVTQCPVSAIVEQVEERARPFESRPDAQLSNPSRFGHIRQRFRRWMRK